MKRYLLMFVVVGLALTAMAQKQFLLNERNAQIKSEFTPKKSSFVSDITLTKFTKTASPRKVMKKEGEEVAYPYGEGIYTELVDAVDDELDADGKVQYVEANRVLSMTLEPSEGVEISDGTVANVYIQYFAGYVFELYGVYDEAAGTLTFPIQVCYQSESYGDCALVAANKDDEYYGPLVFTKDKEGNFVSTQEWQVVIADEESEYYMYYLVKGLEPRILKPNAESSVEYPGQSGRATDVKKNYIEDYETEITVYNTFSGWGDASYVIIEFDDDLNAYMYALQRLGTEDMTEDIVKSFPDLDGSYFSYMRLWGYFYDEDRKDYLLSDEDIVGKLEGNTISFEGPFTIGSGYVENVGALTYGEIGPMTITLTDGKFDILGGDEEPTGIVNANATREYKLKNTPTYNLMGQQVNRRDVRGIMVRNGKKYIAK